MFYFLKIDRAAIYEGKVTLNKTKQNTERNTITRQPHTASEMKLDSPSSSKIRSWIARELNDPVVVANTIYAKRKRFTKTSYHFFHSDLKVMQWNKVRSNEARPFTL